MSYIFIMNIFNSMTHLRKDIKTSFNFEVPPIPQYIEEIIILESFENNRIFIVTLNTDNIRVVKLL